MNSIRIYLQFKSDFSKTTTSFNVYFGTYVPAILIVLLLHDTCNNMHCHIYLWLQLLNVEAVEVN